MKRFFSQLLNSFNTLPLSMSRGVGLSPLCSTSKFSFHNSRFFESGNQDPYDIMGLERDCTQEDVKSRFRELSKKYHPDICKLPKDESRQKFGEINNAYQILGDKENRKAYDDQIKFGGTGGFNFNDANFSGGSGFEDINDIFENLFGGGGQPGGAGFNPFGGMGGGNFSNFQNIPVKGDNKYIMINVDLKDIAYGGSKQLTGLPKAIKCISCNGIGKDIGSTSECHVCEGNGVLVSEQMGFFMQSTCGHCGGSGKISENCDNCEGVGYKIKTKNVKINVPIGVPDGYMIKLEGYGDVGMNGGPPGDMLVKLNVINPKNFKRKDETSIDIMTIMEIDMIKAILGGEEVINNLKGDEIIVEVPQNSQFGDKIIVEKEGIQSDVKTGDMIVRLKVSLPIKINEKQEKLLKQFQEEEFEEEI